MKKINLIYITLFLLLLLVGCDKDHKEESKLKLENVSVLQETKFDAVYVNITNDDFMKLGFKLGDSLNITFSNGYKVTDIPFYNGYYVAPGDHVVVAYPGYPYLAITRNLEGLWSSSELTEQDTVTIQLNESGKYTTIQELFNQNYLDDRNEFESDEEFANYRAVQVSSMKENILYRGCSVCDNQHNRAEYAIQLIKRDGINFVLNLSDTASQYESCVEENKFNMDYLTNLFDKEQVATLGMGANYGSDSYRNSLANGLKKMINYNGPYYVHCVEGKDRTGFVCLLLEALTGATYDEMKKDYMITYDNYYGINEEEEKEKYDAIVSLYFDAFLSYLHNTKDVNVLKNASYVEDAKAYLFKAGMTQAEISTLISKLAK